MVKQVRIRMVHDGVEPGPPLGEPLSFGLPDRMGELHSGVATADGAMRFDLVLTVKGEDGDGRPVFGGSFAHGTPKARFLYLGWRRAGTGGAPWGWRIKIPLAGIGWPEIRAADSQNGYVAADVRGRRPHVVAPLAWQVELPGAAGPAP